MPTPHRHANIIKAWADGIKVQYKNHATNEWNDVDTPSWVGEEYRIKPEPKILHGFALYNEHLGTFQFQENNNRFFAGKPAILTFLPDA